MTDSIIPTRYNKGEMIKVEDNWRPALWTKVNIERRNIKKIVELV